LKFTPAGGEVTIDVSAYGGRCRLEVTDTGVGIEPAELAHLFDRFYRGSAAATGHVRGIGLGLAITKAIVERHGGAIEVDSVVGRGSCFRVWLPRAGAAQPTGVHHTERSGRGALDAVV
jgi:adenylate cyclase